MCFLRDMDLEHPVVTNLRETGHPDRKKPVEPRCPRCRALAENFYTIATGAVVGCDICLTQKPYYEFEEGELQ